MLTKEDFSAGPRRPALFSWRRSVSVFFALAGFAAIPFGDVLPGGRPRDRRCRRSTLNVGILYIFAMLSLGIYGVVLAGWASANNYALLGGQRAAAQMISSEVTIGASIWASDGLRLADLQEIVRGAGPALWGWIPEWGIFTQPLGFILFLTAGIAETKRIPFDLPEGESEIIGYFVEYSGMKFGHVHDDRLRGDDPHRRASRQRSSLAAGRSRICCRTAFTSRGGRWRRAAEPAWSALLQVRVFGIKVFSCLVPHADALDAAALPLRPG